jgi:hypothetical protein
MYRSRLAFALAMAALAAILLPSTLPAQITFERTYGGTGNDWGWSVQQTRDSGYIITGSTTSIGAGRLDVYLVKTSAYGETLWTRAYGGAYNEFGRSVQQTTDSGYVITGYTGSFGAGASDVYLIKTDQDGDTLWTRTYGGPDYEDGHSVQQTADGGYIIAGHTNSFGAGFDDVYLIRTNASGDTLWTRTFGGDTDDYGYSVQQTADSGYVIAGSTTRRGADNFDVYLIRTNARGDTLWTKTYGGEYHDGGYSVLQTAENGFVIVGYTASSGAGSDDVFLINTDAQGDTLWTRTFGGGFDDGSHSLQQTPDNGYIIAGTTSSFGAGTDDVYLVKTDARGNALWTRTFGGTDRDIGSSVQHSADGGFVVAGRTYSFGEGSADFYLIKTDSLGNVAVAEPKTSATRAPALSLSCEPNPFSGTTTIRFSHLASRFSPLSLRIFDAQGRAVRSFSSLLSPPSSLVWDGCDDMGQMLPSGAYFLRLDTGSQHATARIVLQR